MPSTESEPMTQPSDQQHAGGPSNAHLHALNAEYDALLTQGLVAFDENIFVNCWRSMGPYRDQLLISLARKTRFQFRAALTDPQMRGESLSEDAMDELSTSTLRRLLANVIDFGFRYLSKRQIVVLADALALAFEAEMELSDFVWVLGEIATESQYTSPGRAEAVVMGVSGAYQYDLEAMMRLDALDAADQSAQHHGG